MFIATMAGAMSGWQMTRRELIKLLISAVRSWPIDADAQQTIKIVQIGVLWEGRGDRTDASLATLDAFIPELRVFGYVEGQNIAFKRRFADGDTNKLSTLAQELNDRIQS
jgi:putative tryptophan/tyrosine transport system substrate-binding protein